MVQLPCSMQVPSCQVPAGGWPVAHLAARWQSYNGDDERGSPRRSLGPVREMHDACPVDFGRRPQLPRRRGGRGQQASPQVRDSGVGSQWNGTVETTHSGIGEWLVSEFTAWQPIVTNVVLELYWPRCPLLQIFSERILILGNIWNALEWS